MLCIALPVLLLKMQLVTAGLPGFWVTIPPPLTPELPAKKQFVTVMLLRLLFIPATLLALLARNKQSEMVGLQLSK